MESNKFKSYNELLRVANSLESDEEKIELICDYFINNVTYNYAYLEAIRIDRPETGIEDIVRDIDSRYNAYEIEECKYITKLDNKNNKRIIFTRKRRFRLLFFTWYRHRN